MKRNIQITCLIFLAMPVIFISCRKHVEAGTDLSASGVVFDEIKNKPLANAKLYLYGAQQTFYGIYYANGPLDSTTSDKKGKFSIHFKAEGTSIDYGLTLGILGYGGYAYDDQSNYIIDRTEQMFKFNYALNVKNAVVKARELNYTKIHLTVLENPYDTFFVRIDALIRQVSLIKGQSIDTIIYVRHLPGEQNIISYYTESLRDTAGLAELNIDPFGRLYSITRMLNDTIMANMAETLYISKTIPNSLLMPRQ
jgi:hypothetical protein